jgi:phenylpyruvate tautomerase PptA (4-oxalocrotonate tautomerase family)
MPLARIDMPAGKSADYKRAVSDVIYEAIIGILKAPEGDRFHVITEHQPDTLFIDKHFLGIERTADAMIIQVTLRQGRSNEVKQAFFKFIADTLHERIGIRREDVVINLVEDALGDWSFGNGIAQYLVQPPK